MKVYYVWVCQGCGEEFLNEAQAWNCCPPIKESRQHKGDDAA